MIGNFLTRKFKILSIFLVRHRHNINLFHQLNLANSILSPNPDEASKLLLFLLQLPLFVLSDSDIVLLGFIDFTKSLKNRDSGLDSLICGEKHLLPLGCEDQIIHGMSLENSPIM